jgi:hypothetical protein
MLARIVSGGQTGVDRAALDVALELGLPCGSWCPRGRRAEDGANAERHPLTETPWWGYPQRTEWNVRDSDGTLILTRGRPDRGTRLTERLGKPCLVVDLASAADVEDVRQWALSHQIRILNAAGPRESSAPGIHAQARYFLHAQIEGPAG